MANLLLSLLWIRNGFPLFKANALQRRCTRTANMANHISYIVRTPIFPITAKTPIYKCFTKSAVILI